jgi:ABC-2 type transport system permease protein
MPLHDVSYKHWHGAHLGIGHRRLAIAFQALKACLSNRWLRYVLVVCWMGGLSLAAMLFAIGQLLVADSVIVEWTSGLNPMLQMFARNLMTWLDRHPEISVRATQNILFCYASRWLLPLSILALGQAIPHLITRDLSSNAIIIYSSKAIGRLDYLLGKFLAAFGLLALTWLGPLLAAWFFGNLLAPDWHFFWHSRFALGNTLLFVLSGMGILSLLALGVSAIASGEKTTIALWMVWWIAGYALVGMAKQTRPWLKHLSFKHNLDDLALSSFRLHDEIRLMQENIPVLGDILKNVPPATMEALAHPATAGSIVALGAMLAMAVAVVARRVKPE